MASGSFASTVNNSAGSSYSRYIEVVWSSTNNTADNKSTITWDAYVRSNSSSTTNYVFAKYVVVTINGVATTLIGETATRTYKNQKLGSGSLTVSHNTNGTKSVNVSITAQIYTYGTTNSSYTGSITMSPNPVYSLSISPGTGSNITVRRTACAGSGGTGNLSAGTNKLYYGDILKVTFTASNNYSIKTHTVNGATFTSGNTHTVSKNVAVVATATQLKSSISATDANIESTSTITITRYNSSHKHTIKYQFGELSGTIATKTSNTSIGWTIPATFYSQIPNAKTGTCTLTCTTYNGDTSLGSSTCTFTVTASSSKCTPTIVTSVQDTNNTTAALTGDSSHLIRYKSTALCTITATPKNSATISSLSVGGTSVTGSTSNGVTTATKTYTGVSTESFAFVAKDSRGYSTTATKTPVMVKYIQLTCNPVLSRPNPTGGTISMTFSGNIYRGSFGACSNTLTLQYRWRVAGGTYGSWKNITTNITYGTSTYRSSSAITLGEDFDYQLNYEFQIQATDGGTVNGTKYTLSTVTKNITVKRGIPVFDWGENDFNINVPLMLNNVSILNIMYPVGTVYMHSTNTIPTAVGAVGTWAVVSTGISGVYAWKRTA